ncbi:MAG: ATP-binding cassette domain-containing protein [Lactobacillales bacterium]|jgi:ABC-type branched-subunit amino acid transport system ATPase component|nr:ATP-binding cassette domain-containing protein [Lactobacillales bacterium]
MKKAKNKPQNAIEVHALSKHFMGIKAVDSLTVSIQKGIATGLIGPNGSGKTTLMNLLTGLLEPTAGTIIINGKKYKKIKPTILRDLKIARTFQDSRLIEQLSVRDNLMLPIAQAHYWKGFLEFTNKEKNKKVNEVLKIIGLESHKNANAGTLSYGQRKLLEVGRSLVQDADIYFFDEPFTGLFPEVVEHILGILRGLKEQGKTLIVIEHDMALIQKLCDDAIVLDYGHLLATGKPAEVLADKNVKEAYLGK